MIVHDPNSDYSYEAMPCGPQVARAWALYQAEFGAWEGRAFEYLAARERRAAQQAHKALADGMRRLRIAESRLVAWVLTEHDAYRDTYGYSPLFYYMGQVISVWPDHCQWNDYIDRGYHLSETLLPRTFNEIHERMDRLHSRSLWTGSELVIINDSQENDIS